MPNPIQDIATVDNDSFPYILEKNVSIPLKRSSGVVRTNVYRPKSSTTEPVPVLVTYVPVSIPFIKTPVFRFISLPGSLPTQLSDDSQYGKDIYYGEQVEFELTFR